MRNYFNLKLKGSQIFYYAVIGWAATILLSIILSLPSIRAAASCTIEAPEDRLLDMSYIWGVLATLGICLVGVTIRFGVLFFVVKASVAGLSLETEPFEPEYDFKRFTWIVVKGVLLSIITLGIYYPWFVVRVLNYFTENTAFRLNTFRFNGKGATLFGIVILTIVLPIFLAVVGIAAVGSLAAVGGHSMEILWICLAAFAFIFIMAFSVALSLKWLFDFQYGPKRIASDMKLIPSTFYIIGQAFLVAITMGLYAPMYMLRTYRYFAGHTILVGETVEKRFGFTLNVWKDYFYLLGQGLLTIITIGIYWPWAYAKVATRLAAHTYIDDVEHKN